MALVWSEKASRAALQTSSLLVITHSHSFGTDTQHDYSQGNCRTMSSIIIKLEQQVVYCKLQSNFILCMKFSPRLYKYRESFVLYIPTVHAFGSVLHTVFWQRHTYMTCPPPGVYFLAKSHEGRKASHNNFSSEPYSHFLVQATSESSSFDCSVFQSFQFSKIKLFF